MTAGRREETPEEACLPSPARSLVFVSLLSLIVLAGSADAARVSGTVTDPHGRAVPSARVQLEVATGAIQRTDAGADGAFVFADVPAGTFVIRAFAEGFVGDAARVIVADAAADVIAPVTLRIAAVADTIVVSASAMEAPLSSVPASTTVIAAEDLRVAQSETLADALRRVPGLGVAASGGRGAVTSLFPRGGESDYTLVMLDGVRVNGFGGGVDAAHLPVEGLDRVEVVRGPQSALFGADAIGGVVQLVTRRGGPLRGTALVEGGDGETRRTAVDASASVGDWSWHASGGYQDSQGLNGDRTAAGETVANDDYVARRLAAGTGWQQSGREVRGLVHVTSTSRGNPGPFGSDPNHTFAGIDRLARGTLEQVTGGISAAQTLGSSLRARAHATLADLDSGYRDAFGATATETQRVTGRVQVDWSAAARVGVSAGAEALRERARNTYITGDAAAPIPIRRRVVGTFAEARYDDGARVFLAGGLRAEHIAREALAGSPSPFAPRPPFGRDALVSWNPKIAVSWVALPMGARGVSTRLTANAGTGIRPPDAFEIAFTDNPSLEPERSRSVDAGVQQLVWGGRVAIDATWFANHYDDLIVAVGPAFTDVSRYRTDNISNARARGLELAGAVRLPAGLTLRTGYTYLRTEILAVDGGSSAPAPFAVGDPLLRRPRHQGFVDATVVRDRVDAFLRVGARGEVLDVDPTYGAFGGTLAAPGFATVDVGASWQPIRGTRHALFARVTNLLDRAYEDAIGFPALGRSAIVGVRLAHGR